MKKLKSGSWHANINLGKDEDGKQITKSVTAPTRAACEYEVSRIKKEFKSNLKHTRSGLTVGDVVSKYISLQATLSPTTIDSYKRIRAYAFPDLMQQPVQVLTPELMQRAVNSECERIGRSGKPLSPKTIKNEYGLVAAALSEICAMHFNVKLPKRVRDIKEYPEPDLVIDRITGTDIELPCLLALWLSFSMSEIRGLKCSSVKDGIIYINQVLVDTSKGVIEKSNAKVETRNRKHEVPEYLLKLIESQPHYKKYLKTGHDSYLVQKSRSALYGRFQTLTKGLELSFHDLRHLNASVMLQLNIPEKYAMERGGWSTPHVMQTVYQHTFSKARLEVDNVINEYFNQLIKKSMKQKNETQVINVDFSRII